MTGFYNTLSFLLDIIAFVITEEPQQCRHYPGEVRFLGSHDEERNTRIYQGSIGQSSTDSVTFGNSPNKGLDLWYLLTPGNTIAANMSRIFDHGKLAAPIQVDMKSLGHPRTTFNLPHYAKIVDVTKYSIVLSAWYLICISIRVYFGQNMQICQHCTVLTASLDEKTTKVVNLVQPSFQCGDEDAVTLEYQITDFPVHFKVITTVYGRGGHNCLQGGPIIPKYETILNVEPNSVAFVDLNLIGLKVENYSVVTSLVFTFDQQVIVTNFYSNDQSRRQINSRSSGFWVLWKNSDRQWRLTLD